MNRVYAISASLISIGVVSLTYFIFFSTSARLKSEVKQSLQQFSDAVETRDRAKVKAVITDVIDDKARIKLKFDIISITQQMPPPALDLGKAEFIAFIDSAMTDMTEYTFEYRMGGFTLADDRKSANLTFTSKEWGDGPTTYGASTIISRLSANSECSAKALFQTAKPKLSELNCTINYRSMPRAQELNKVKDELKQQIQDINKNGR